MSTNSIEEAIRELTKTEVKVLYYKCLGLKRWEIANEIGYGEDMVQIHMSNVYRKLGFDLSMHWQQRKKILEQEYCPALKTMAPTIDALEYWPPDLPNPQPDVTAIVLVMQDDIEEEKEYREEQKRLELIKVPEPVVISVSSQKDNGGRRRWWCLLIPIIGLIVLAAIVGAYYLGRQSIFPSISTEMPTESSTINPTATPNEINTREATEPEVIPVSTSTPEPPRNTPTVADTPTDTPTPTDTTTPTPGPDVLFEDSFENGQLQEWDIPEGQKGEPFWTEGKLTITGDLWMFVGSTDWTNYQVRIDGKITPFGTNPTPLDPDFFVVRVVDSNNMVALHVSSWVDQWVIIENGEWKPVPGTEFHGNQEPSVIIISVTDQVYSYTIDGTPGPDLNTDKFPQGRVGMWLRAGTEITNFKVIQLP